MKKAFITASLLVMNVLGASMVSANEILPEINPIKPGIETIVSGSQNSRQYTMIDHNPTHYNKKFVGNHIVESWAKDNAVSTRVDGVVTNSYRINKDLETIESGSKNSRQYTVIDHNPSHYSKKIIGGHTVEGWMENGVVNTRIDGVPSKH